MFAKKLSIHPVNLEMGSIYCGPICITGRLGLYVSSARYADLVVFACVFPRRTVCTKFWFPQRLSGSLVALPSHVFCSIKDKLSGWAIYPLWG
jgi:hypothetical protein